MQIEYFRFFSCASLIKKFCICSRDIGVVLLVGRGERHVTQPIPLHNVHTLLVGDLISSDELLNSPLLYGVKLNGVLP